MFSGNRCRSATTCKNHSGWCWTSRHGVRVHDCVAGEIEGEIDRKRHFNVIAAYCKRVGTGGHDGR